MKKFIIDLASDTKTRPTKEMKEFMMNAEVGDEQAGEDPSVNQLVEMVCEILGKEDGLYLPSGTMCNQIAIKVHCQPGDEIIGDKTCHVRNFETGGPAANAGALVYPLEGQNGIFTPEQLKSAIRYPSNYDPRSRLVVIEQTSNLGGGTIWPLEYVKEISDHAHQKGLSMHMDGARLFNAVVETGISAKQYADHFDSVWIDFSKGLGAPIGAVLVSNKEFIRKARRYKHMFGGAMRQAGIVASAGIYALKNNIDRLKIDHANAKLLEQGLKEINGLSVGKAVTNIIYIDTTGLNMTADEINSKLEPYSIRFSTLGEYMLRAVTHLDVSEENIKEVNETMKKLFS
ncbi:MAG: threonine aldolase family protein [Candidatus Hodarchaeales archaeon]